MNTNQIVTDRFSNSDSQAMYYDKWSHEPDTANNFYYNGKQCGGCSFYGKFDSDWGLCCHPESRHHLETVFEHFTCPSYEEDGWDAHHFLTRKLRDYFENSEKADVTICRLVSDYVSANNLGVITPRGIGYDLHEGLWTFKPDLGFIAKDREINNIHETYTITPDLAIIIVTSFDKAQELNHEAMMYLESGTRQVWLVFPYYYPIESIWVCYLTSELQFKADILTKADILDGNDILPGFHVSVREIFQYLKR